MHSLITGASGIVGRFVTKALHEAGHDITLLGRRPLEGCSSGFHAFDLKDSHPSLPEADLLIHCALQHEPGRYRGGEGDNPEAFYETNVEGTRRLFQAAVTAGVPKIVFLSSRAIYGDKRVGERLFEDDLPQPDTFYGKVKLAGEHALAACACEGIVLRATGVYGVPSGLNSHKWQELFERAGQGQQVAARIASEVHGRDLADAVLRTSKSDALVNERFKIFNVSDLVLDRHDLLKEYGVQTGKSVFVPERSLDRPGEMDTRKLRALGWAPGGLEGLRNFLAQELK